MNIIYQFASKVCNFLGIKVFQLFHCFPSKGPREGGGEGRERRRKRKKGRGRKGGGGRERKEGEKGRGRKEGGERKGEKGRGRKERKRKDVNEPVFRHYPTHSLKFLLSLLRGIFCFLQLSNCL